jgi:hypothetical protein
MKSTLSFVVAAVVVGIVAGIAVGYWEARPWAAGGAMTSAGPDGKDPTPTTAGQTEQGAPRATIAETTFQFGNMESGATQSHEFLLQNEGDAPLSVNFVSHTCKCTEVNLGGKLVEPGAGVVVPPHDEAKIKLEWAAKVPPGPFRHGATFTTNDPKLERLELIVEGQIVASTALEPSQLLFGSIHIGEPAKTELVVMSFLEPEVQVLSHEIIGDQLAGRMEISVEPLAADALPSSQAKAGVKVIAHFDPKGTLGPFNGSVRLLTNLKKNGKFEVPVHGTVKGDVSIFGPGWNEASGLLRMKPISSAEGGVSKLNINIRGDHSADAELRIASVDPPQLKATLGERKRIRDGLISMPLTVEVPAGTRPMVRAGEEEGGEGEIVLETTLPDTKQVRLRVAFTVQP